MIFLMVIEIMHFGFRLKSNLCVRVVCGVYVFLLSKSDDLPDRRIFFFNLERDLMNDSS